MSGRRRRSTSCDRQLSCRPRASEVLHDRTGFAIRRRSLERLIAHRQILAQRPRKDIERSPAFVQVRKLFRKHVADVTASTSTLAVLVADQVPNFPERQAMRLRLLDEPDAFDGGAI